MVIYPARQIAGRLSFAGDKSISHRLVLLAVLNSGTITASNLSQCRDVISSIEAVQKLGVKVSRHNDVLTLSNNGLHNSDSCCNIDCGNSGTTARLLAGILVSRPGQYRLSGDQSLSNRPMQRIIAPLTGMGANINSMGFERLPLEIAGRKDLHQIDFCNSNSSAQVKSAILFAALQAWGRTNIYEKVGSRDHTERLFKLLNLPISTSAGEISISGPINLSGDFSCSIPGDISSAAFFAVAAAIIPGSELLLSDVLLNPTRTGFLAVLQRMGAHIKITKTSDDWEPRGDIFIRGSELKGTEIKAVEIPSLIDEIPAIAVAMAFANGKSTITGAQELRHKEIDRIKGLCTEFAKANIKCHELADGLEIHGPARIINQCSFSAQGDHRLAMALAILSLNSEKGLLLQDPDCVKISCPDFFLKLTSICR